MNNLIKVLIVLLFLQFGFVSSVMAVSSIQVMALFNGKAVIKIDASRHTLSVGQSSPEGVKLISADSERAVLQVNGKKKTYRIGHTVSIGTQFAKQSELVVLVYPDSMGMYFVFGSANGYPIKFLIDTGATTIAMNSTQAERLGIDYRLIGKQTMVSTASGTAKAYAVNLKKVKVGEIEVSNVKALVVDGGFPREVLLGMSFLSRVSIQREGRQMKLKQKN